MHRLPGNKNSNGSIIILFLLISIFSGFVSLQAQVAVSEVDTVLDVTRAARLIVTDLLNEEKSQSILIDSLMYQNTMDSLTISQMIRIQNEQRAKLMTLGGQIDQTRQSHQQLVYEIDKIKPAYSDLIIPGAAGIIGGVLYSGETGEKFAIGLFIYGTLFTLKHFGVY